MKRLAGFLAVAALLLTVGVPMAEASRTAAKKTTTTKATFTKHTYTAVDGRTRDYWVFVPSGKRIAGRPLVVYLHGCNQTAEQAAHATQFNRLAERRGFLVAYPDQKVTPGQSAPYVDGNGAGCWNWFLPDNQARGQGEAALIAGITRAVMREHRADARRVYLEGISAGGAMSVVMGATYPDVYRAVAVLAGCSFRTCSDSSGQLAYRAMGERARRVPMFIENGSADPANPLPQAQALTQSWLGVIDLVDDGALNGSVPRRPASTTRYDFRQTPRPGSGDACLDNTSTTCPGGVIGFQDTYPHTVEQYADARGCEVVQFWTIHGLTHAQPHAPPGTEFGDPLGPDMTKASYDFFTTHAPRGSCVRIGGGR